MTWTSPEPRGVGTTRVVEMRGGFKPLVGDGIARLAMVVTGPLLNLGLRGFLGNLRRYTDRRFAATQKH